MKKTHKETAKSLRNAYNARIKKARMDCESLLQILKNIEEGKETINRMSDCRTRLASVTQAMHEASAYHSCYDTLTADDEEAA